MKEIILCIAISLISGYAFGKTQYNCKGEVVTKGTAIKLLVSGQVKSCLETREVTFNDKSGTLRGVK